MAHTTLLILKYLFWFLNFISKRRRSLIHWFIPQMTKRVRFGWQKPGASLFHRVISDQNRRTLSSCLQGHTGIRRLESGTDWIWTQLHLHEIQAHMSSGAFTIVPKTHPSYHILNLKKFYITCNYILISVFYYEIYLWYILVSWKDEILI